jgi:hypothetical protein
MLQVVQPMVTYNGLVLGEMRKRLRPEPTKLILSPRIRRNQQSNIQAEDVVLFVFPLPSQLLLSYNFSSIPSFTHTFQLLVLDLQLCNAAVKNSTAVGRDLPALHAKAVLSVREKGTMMALGTDAHSSSCWQQRRPYCSRLTMAIQGHTTNEEGDLGGEVPKRH